MTARRYLIEGDSASGDAEPLSDLGELGDPEASGQRLAALARELEGSPLVVPRPWGSEFDPDVDPWPSTLSAEAPAAVWRSLRERFTAQRPGRIPRLTWALRLPEAGARVTLELHDELVVMALHGAGAMTPEELLGKGQRARTEQELLAELAALRSAEMYSDELLLRGRAAIVGLGALWHSDLRLLGLLRELGRHPRRELRSAVIAVASRLGYRLFLLELLAVETDRMLRRVLEPVTAFAEEA